MNFRYKILPKLFYFAVELSFLIPLIYINMDELISDGSNLCLLLAVLIVTFLTYY